MKHNWKITLLLLALFVGAQIVGLFVSHAYMPEHITVINETTGLPENQTSYDIPYGFNPPAEVHPEGSLLSMVIALIIAVCLMFFLMRFRAETFLRLWFFVVITMGIALALNAFFSYVTIHAAWVALAFALPLAYLKIFKRNLIVHNATEMLIYPGIAAVFIPLLSVGTVIVLLILISAYDIYAVWHAGFMQKMARYQIEKLRLFSGFFIPYVSKEHRLALQKAKNSGKRAKKVPVHVGILGGGDVVFPIILAGVILPVFGLAAALTVSIGATLALGLLFYFSEKGKFYPAMPFISAGCFLALLLIYLFF